MASLRRTVPPTALVARAVAAAVAIAVASGSTAGIAGPARCAVAQERTADADEAPLDVAAIAAYAAPSARDLVHRSVDWLPTALDGIVAAQAADKPIVLWLYFGGPLGDC
ncbi:MAG: hypothetical protein R3F34_11665 [Planctomycetota bacterium]